MTQEQIQEAYDEVVERCEDGLHEALKETRVPNDYWREKYIQDMTLILEVAHEVL